MVDMSGAGGQQLGKLEPVDPRAIWPHEALNFTPWLAQNADRLAEALGIEMELDATEHAVGGYSLDVIGKDQTNGTILIVENQLGESDTRPPWPAADLRRGDRRVYHRVDHHALSR
jgi:hypothetical protein